MVLRPRGRLRPLLPLPRRHILRQTSIPKGIPLQTPRRPHAHAQRTVQAQSTIMPLHVGFSPRIVESHVEHIHDTDGIVQFYGGKDAYYREYRDILRDQTTIGAREFRLEC